MGLAWGWPGTGRGRWGYGRACSWGQGRGSKCPGRVPWDGVADVHGQLAPLMSCTTDMLPGKIQGFDVAAVPCGALVAGRATTASMFVVPDNDSLRHCLLSWPRALQVCLVRRVPEAQLASEPGRAIPLNDTARPLPFIGPLPVRPDGTVGERGVAGTGVVRGQSCKGVQEGRKGKCWRWDRMSSRVRAAVTKILNRGSTMCCGWRCLPACPGGRGVGWARSGPYAYSQGVLSPSCITPR